MTFYREPGNDRIEPNAGQKFEKIVAKANDCASIDTEGTIAVIAGETDSYEADAMVDRRMHDRLRTLDVLYKLCFQRYKQASREAERDGFHTSCEVTERCLCTMPD